MLFRSVSQSRYLCHALDVSYISLAISLAISNALSVPGLVVSLGPPLANFDTSYDCVTSPSAAGVDPEIGSNGAVGTHS